MLWQISLVGGKEAPVLYSIVLLDVRGVLTCIRVEYNEFAAEVVSTFSVEHMNGFFVADRSL